MLRTSKLPLLLLFLLIFVGCASKSRKAHERVREAVRDGKYKEALEFVKGDDFYPEKNSRLLKLLEIATVQELNGNYHQAIMTFDAAKDLSDELYTVSISKKISSAVVNSNVDNYYGTSFERSMIRYYQVLTHYLLYLKGEYEAYEVINRNEDGKITNTTQVPAKKLSDSERRFHLSAAKSVLIEWNSMLDTLKAENPGKAVYKDDLLAKVFGGFIHEQVGTTNDKQIALALYKEGKKILFRNFNMLSSYNNKSKEFASHYKEFENMNEKEIEKKYVSKTDAYIGLEAFLDKQIQRLTDKKHNTVNSVMVLIENGMISPKKVKKFEFPIPVSSIPATVAGGDFMTFSATLLRSAVKTAPIIYFEMPEIPDAPVVNTQAINILNDAGTVVATQNLATLNPLSNLANYQLSEEAIGNYAKVGLRVGAKHVVALVAAFALYKNRKESMGDFVALTLAAGTYAAANKGIQMSEEADLRGWNMLPSQFSSTAFQLKPGKYQAEYVLGEKKTPIGQFVVDNKQTVLLNYRTH